MPNSEYGINLEKHETKDVSDGHVNGSLTVVWRDWDKIIKNPINMIYVSSVNPGESKGPHIHTKRCPITQMIKEAYEDLTKINDSDKYEFILPEITFDKYLINNEK